MNNSETPIGGNGKEKKNKLAEYIKGNRLPEIHTVSFDTIAKDNEKGNGFIINFNDDEMGKTQIPDLSSQIVTIQVHSEKDDPAKYAQMRAKAANKNNEKVLDDMER